MTNAPGRRQTAATRLPSTSRKRRRGKISIIRRPTRASLSPAATRSICRRRRLAPVSRSSYDGRDLRTRDPVVVKTLRLEYRGDPEMRARFRREARLLQFLSHPNVIRALAFSEERGAPWLVLERIRGRSLREEIAMGAPFTPEEVVPLLQGFAAALDHLHARGLAHLDVRPENVIVTPDGEVKLIDFGVAQAAGAMQEPADGGRLDRRRLPGPGTGLRRASEPRDRRLCPGVRGLRTPHRRNRHLSRPKNQRPGTPLSALASSRLLCRRRLPVVATPCPHGSTTSCWARSSAIRGSATAAPDRSPPFFTPASRGMSTSKRDGLERRVEPPSSRQFPNNEPGIAVKGSAVLASRRGTHHRCGRWA